MLSSIAMEARSGVFGSSPGSSSTAKSAPGTSFADLLVSTSGTATDARAGDRATAAAATAASADVDGLAHLIQGLGGNPNKATIGVETIDRFGHVLASASLDGDGDPSVFGTGTSGGATSSVDMSLSSQADGGTWFAHSSAELAQARYELNALATQSLAAASSRASVDLAA
jgi:hypothetical protein